MHCNIYLETLYKAKEEEFVWSLYWLYRADSTLWNDGKGPDLPISYPYDCGKSRHNIMAQTEQRWAYKIHGINNSKALGHRSLFSRHESHVTIIMIGRGEF